MLLNLIKNSRKEEKMKQPSKQLLLFPSTTTTDPGKTIFFTTGFLDLEKHTKKKNIPLAFEKIYRKKNYIITGSIKHLHYLLLFLLFFFCFYFSSILFKGIESLLKKRMKERNKAENTGKDVFSSLRVIYIIALQSDRL